MFAEFVDEYRSRVGSRSAPVHYRAVFAELGDWMARWSRAFA